MAARLARTTAWRRSFRDERRDEHRRDRAQLQAWLGKTVWISVHAGETGPLLAGQGELAHERDNLDVEQIQAAEFGGELRGLAFVFSVGAWRLYISSNNFRSATSHGNHEVRIRPTWRRRSDPR
jgi:hypothetical protein